MNRVQGKSIFKGWPKEAAKEAGGKPGAIVFCCWPSAFISPFFCQERSDLPLGNSLLPYSQSCGLDPRGETLAGSA